MLSLRIVIGLQKIENSLIGGEGRFEPSPFLIKLIALPIPHIQLL